ncbi:hypothetical protein SAMN05444000_101138 [Shimia gijangensis]|uniref:DUF1643 domain-containing protein n=1 Tax=Shimia gijangensis TaxID=1470563 RepID=A0A1M6B6B3_9RHOB|nr:DUF1643 domain-containing protein [Shimia gijangensis]SHI44245.1 hypothetical protein SAMN05444000_101138 [Shimia gijangensis]
MITRHHQKDDAASQAEYSECGTYRYSLSRVWQPEGKRVVFIMLNPSKATEKQNDPTIERCERRARALGFGGFCAVNIFALRETDPKKMRAHKSPEGPENDLAITQACHWADTIIAAWGAHGDHLNRGAAMQNVLRATGRPVHCLGLTKKGHPGHPLYIAYAQKPELWDISI